MIDVKDIVQCKTDLSDAFDALEQYLQDRSYEKRDFHSLVEIQRDGELCAENESLKHQLEQVQHECSEWKVACSNVVEKLNTAIDTVAYLLNEKKE